MTIETLRDKLMDLDVKYNDVDVVCSGSDHSLYIVDGHLTDAELVIEKKMGGSRKSYSEYYDDLNMSEDGKKVKVFLVE